MSRCNNVKGGHGNPPLPPDTLGFDQAGYSAFAFAFGYCQSRLECRADGEVWAISTTDPDMMVGTWYTGVLPGGNVPSDYELTWINNVGQPDPPPASSDFPFNPVNLGGTVFYTIESFGGLSVTGGFWDINLAGGGALISNCFVSLDADGN